MKLIAGILGAWQRLVPATKHDRNTIMAKLNELAALLTAVDTEVQKIGTEVQALKDALANTELPADAQTALDNLTAHVKAVDDLNPDAPTA